MSPLKKKNGRKVTQCIHSILVLRETGMLGSFFYHFVQGRQLLWLPLCFSVHQPSSEKVSTLKEKNLLPQAGSKFFSCRVDPFQMMMIMIW